VKLPLPTSPAVPVFAFACVLQCVPITLPMLNTKDSALTSRGEVLALLLHAALAAKGGLSKACPTRFALLPSHDVVSCNHTVVEVGLLRAQHLIWGTSIWVSANCSTADQLCIVMYYRQTAPAHPACSATALASPPAAHNPVHCVPKIPLTISLCLLFHVLPCRTGTRPPA
jgi:hypothetical protein